MKRLIIDSKYAYACIEVDRKNEVVFAAPIFKWMKGKNLSDIRKICQRKGWKLFEIQEDTSIKK